MKLAVVLIGILCSVSAQTTDSTRCLDANTAINDETDCQSVFNYAAATTLADSVTLQESLSRGCSDMNCTSFIQDHIRFCGAAVVSPTEILGHQCVANI